ncbi:secreted ookinete protein, putative [Babesia ovata]|uniref:Secreted ookinete protein, putative n=1 Tax=Babesia ovata TaxID=189622 RepID=A0A2H6K6L1_9APIC|nr:secreted ookinete protein, putative [Babesia ovata]GBE58619.1 secreted ookinete protein, putative [Babesia ovata]
MQGVLAGILISLWAIAWIPAVYTVSEQHKLTPFGPGMRNAVMSGIQDSADFAVKIHPPVEDLDETLKSLDGIMMMEDAERHAANEDFVDAEQRLLAVHKAKIREIVAAAMEPIHAMFPVKFQEVMENDNEL